ncbi:hypothetical protein ACQBAU_11645 [Propionibacteriaceae bacterium Y2011]
MSAEAPHDHLAGAVHEVTIGVFGPKVAVRQLMQVGQPLADSGVRFIAGIMGDPAESAEQFERLADRVHVAVLPGPWHHDQFRTLGPPVPSIAVPLTAESLYVGLLRAQRAGVDIERVSIDSMTRADVAEAYEELGLSDRQVEVMPYDFGARPADYHDFHRSHHTGGRTMLALTTFFEVLRELEADDVPVARMRPTRQTVRRTLSTALLLARGSRLHDNQIAMVAVQLPPTGDGTPEGPSNYWFQELALSVHRFLLDEVRRIGAILRPRSDSRFMITTTRGGLEEITGGLTTAPFLARCRAELGIDLRIGVGLGTTAQEAERQALTGVDIAATPAAHGHAALVDGPGGHRLLPPAGPEATPITADDRAVEVLRTLVAARRGGRSTGSARLQRTADLIVGVDDVAGILDVTPRSARRIAKTLVEAGLAWPTTPLRSPSGGRPRQQFRLLAEKLTTTEAPVRGEESNDRAG